MVCSVYGQKHRGKGALKRALDALDLVGLSEKKDITVAHITLSDRRLLEVAMVPIGFTLTSIALTAARVFRLMH